MLKNNNPKLEIEDWVKAESESGELLHGYIVSINLLQDTAKIYVVACDNEETVGRTLELSRNRIAKLPILVKEQEEQILALIDLALLTGDKTWFMELSTKLNALRQRFNKNGVNNRTVTNRLWKSTIKE